VEGILMSLPLWKTDCGCTQEVAMGAKRDRFCEHGRPYLRVREDGSLVRGLGYSGEPDRDWTDARAKVEEEGSCRICKREATPKHPLEAAHILGREHDEPKVSKRTGEILKELYVHPDRIVPLCGPFPAGCHGDVDHNRVNLVHHLTIEEQVQAVKDAGGIAPAWVELAPVGPREDEKAAA
jgi:hypothetical protein